MVGIVIQHISDFLAWLGGADKTVLKKVPQARSRFAQMGGVLLTTAGIAVVSMTFALHDAVKAPWAVAGFLGFLWGGVILNLDRLLVLSIGATRDKRNMLLMALPRLAMAIVLAVVISTPLVLRIFQSDINNQLFIMHQEASAQQKTLEANSNEQHEVNQLNAEIAADNRILAGNLPVNVTNPQLQTAQARVTALQSQESQQQTTVDNDIEAYQCELYGSGPNCAGATDKQGKGPIYEAKYLRYQQDLATLNTTKAQLKTAIAQENAVEKQLASSQASTLKRDQTAAAAALPGLNKSLAKINAFLQQQDAAGTAVNNANTGLLAQISALFAASGNSLALTLSHLSVFLLFFLIEILPVTVKLLLNLEKENPYESVVKKNNNEIIDEMKIKRAETRQISEQKSQVRIAVEADMRKREVYLGTHANEYVEAEMIKILDAALQQWSSQVTSQLSNDRPTAATGAPPLNIGGFPPTGGQTPPNPAAGFPAPGAAGGQRPENTASPGVSPPAPGGAQPAGRHAVPTAPGGPPAGYGNAPAGNGQAPAGYGQSPAGYGQGPAGYGGVTAANGNGVPGHGGPPPSQVQTNTYINLPDDDDL